MREQHEVKALAIIPRSIDEVQTMAEVLAKSKLLPDALKGQSADVVVQILAGQELGLAPMASIRGVHIVQGKPLLAADTMVALVLGSGLCEYFSCVAETDTSVTYETKRRGSPHPQRMTWSDEDTKIAGLNTKDNWRLHKKQMRRARAKAILARDVFPDVLAGCYDPDEIQIPATQRNTVAIDAVDAEFVDVPAEVEATPHEILALEHTKSEAEVKEMAPVLGKLPAKWKSLASEKYKARLAFHRENKAEGVA
jgi:hypothetical protein